MCEKSAIAAGWEVAGQRDRGAVAQGRLASFIMATISVSTTPTRSVVVRRHSARATSGAPTTYGAAGGWHRMVSDMELGSKKTEAQRRINWRSRRMGGSGGNGSSGGSSRNTAAQRAAGGKGVRRRTKRPADRKQLRESRVAVDCHVEHSDSAARRVAVAVGAERSDRGRPAEKRREREQRGDGQRRAGRLGEVPAGRDAVWSVSLPHHCRGPALRSCARLARWLFNEAGRRATRRAASSPPINSPPP